ncbi:unnamed protein product [Paramecium pentaurelia]|uniref:WD40-repeat-containing domain n=1 Tax=Paramecium pentaurelia TaxID=43138 RepID=A0A8S1W9Y5_9CILI|nr:unnamed protein product [Paramecium pentaurelia]
MKKQEDDFIKRMKLYENKFIFLTEQGKVVIKETDSQFEQQINFPNPVYDAICYNDLLITSIRNMPIVIYQKEDGEWKQQMRLHDIKPNSELFLAPLDMKRLTESNNVIGCGKGFLHEYDLQKFSIINYKCIKNYEYISCLDCCEQNENYGIAKNILLLGQFNKIIKIVDTLQDKQIGEAKVHIGGITHLKFDKLDSLYFYSCARFDDYIYQWDLRNTSTFLQYFERKNQTNQRMNFDINHKRELLVGNDDGTAYVYKNDLKKVEFLISNSCVHSSIIQDDGKCYVSFGQRNFDESRTFQTGIQNFTINS